MLRGKPKLETFGQIEWIPTFGKRGSNIAKIKQCLLNVNTFFLK
jgi:hypothetical protein